MNEVVMVSCFCDTLGLVSTELMLGLMVLTTLGLMVLTTLGLVSTDWWNLLRSAALL
jgi:hypothetical protein